MPTSLADALFTTTQQRVLALLYGQPSRSFFASELTGSGSGAVQRELKRLSSSGLVTVTPIGKQKHYQANTECPVFEELRGLVVKTVAMVEPIRQALEPLGERVALALIYGSVARGTDTAASDIGLLVVADELTLEELYSALAPVETALDRRINPTLYTPTEYEARKAAGNGFLARVLAGKPDALIEVPAGGGFADMVKLNGDKEIGDKISKIIGRLAEANDLKGVIDQADFNDESKLGGGKEMQDRLSKLVMIFDGLDSRAKRAEGDDLLGDAYEYLMRHFATDSGKSKGQFYTPAEVSRIMAQVVGIDADTRQDQTADSKSKRANYPRSPVSRTSPNGYRVKDGGRRSVRCRRRLTSGGQGLLLQSFCIPAIHGGQVAADDSAGWAATGVCGISERAPGCGGAMDRSAVLRRPLEATGQDDAMGGARAA